VRVSHRALTLKYRPQTFADMIGQEHVSHVLARALETGRVAQAYLFTGARGVGKTTTARILAKALNCEKRATGEQPGADPCNACTNCAEITNGVSLDVIEIDGASNRGIADVQALREKVRFTPTGGRWRVVIIDEVHQLSNDAFAALLKTLEEPPPHLVFIFATTDPQKLPDTIRSRTQRFDFARVPVRQVADRLLEIQRREQADPEGCHFTLASDAAVLIAHKGEGSLRDAVSGLDQVVSAGDTEVDIPLVRRVLGIADREAFFAIADAIIGRDPKQALHALHRAYDKGLDARELADGLAEHLRHVLVLKVDAAAGDLVPAGREDLERLRAQGEHWSEGDLLRLLRLASETSLPMRDSPQPLVHLEAAVLQMATLEPGELLGELLERLEQLEQRLNGGGGGGGRAAVRGDHEVAAAAPVPVAAPAQAWRPPGAPTASAAGIPQPGPAIPVGAAPTAVAELTAEPAAADAAAPDADTAACWRAAIACVNQRKRMLGAFLEESRFAGVSEGRAVLVTDQLHRTVIEEKENRAIVEEELSRAFGRAVALACATGDDPPRRPPALEDVRPMIEQAIAWFDGEAVPPRARRNERTEG
jgi:DNA polymerase III subunit gamma/tau